MIVKIELPKQPNGIIPSARVSSQDREVDFSVPMSRPLLGKMNGRRVAYFQMSISEEEVEIGDEEVGQSW